MKKILVTGASGFIGNYVIQELLKNNYAVIATSFDTQKTSSASWFSLVKYIPFDLKKFDPQINYHHYFGEPDLLIHLAWEGLPNYKSSFHVEENLPRHYSFLENLISNGLGDITVTGTCLEYGMQESCLQEDMTTQPANPYAVAKDMLRKKLVQLQQQKPFHLKWARLFYLYGSGQSPNSLLSQLDKALSNGEEIFNMSGGEQQRDYLPVEKAAEYIVKIALQTKISGAINCCSGEPVTVKQLVLDHLKSKQQHIALNLGYYPYPDYEPMHFWGDDKKLKNITNQL